MRQTSASVLILFVLGLIGGAFTAGCAIAMPSPLTSAGAHAPACCSLVTCAGGSCFSRAKQDCPAGSAQAAIAQKKQAGADLKAAAALPASPMLVRANDGPLTAPIHRGRVLEPIASYRDVYARTGRLLI